MILRVESHMHLSFREIQHYASLGLLDMPKDEWNKVLDKRVDQPNQSLSEVYKNG